jgi:DNA topoisomerase-2
MPPRQNKSDKLKLAVDAIASNKTSINLGAGPSTSQNKKKEDIEPIIQFNDDNKEEFNSSFNISQKSGDISYKKLQLHEQILLRPDTYIGSVKNVQSIEPVYIMSENKITQETINFPEGLIRIFIEVVSNAIDNVWRSLEYKIIPKNIKIFIDKESGRFTIFNDGKNISVDNHSCENIPIPELIFGNLLTSSNYNDEEERKTSGRNGYGVKLCNIFSKEFTIKIFNKSEKKLYSQTWSNNMYDKSNPVVEKYSPLL